MSVAVRTPIRVAALKRGPYAGVVGFAVEIAPGLYEFRGQRTPGVHPVWQALAEDLILMESIEPATLRVGAWQVELHPLVGEAVAWKSTSNLTHTAPLIRFPNGWRVSDHWSTPVPRTVAAAAARAVKGWTR